MRQLLIAGCGDLGQRLALRLAGQDWEVTGLRRQPARLDPAIKPVAADLLDPATLRAVAGDWDAIIYPATPGERSPEAYRAAYVTGLTHLLASARAARLIFVSSTAVYGQDNGEWVDEHSPTEPASFSGQVLLEAEAITARHDGQVVRFAGIYGPGREYLIRSVRSGQARCRQHPPQWTNRIHADDCAGVLQHLLELEQIEGIYCGSDSRPAPRCEVLNWLATELGLPAPSSAAGDEGQGKRVSNQRLIASGFQFQYPDYLSGYRTLLT